MRTARPQTPLVVSREERETLESLAHRSRTAPQLARRTRIVLACADGLDNNDAQVEAVVIRTLESKPCGATHGSLRSMAKASGPSRMTVSRAWKAFGLQPHRMGSFKLSPDPLPIDKVRDIGLYMNPPDHALVPRVEDKSQIQALERTQPLLPMRPR